MSYEVKWVYWDEEDEQTYFESKRYDTLLAATDRYQHMINDSNAISATISVTLEEFRRHNE